jgi:hypothetical protein
MRLLVKSEMEPQKHMLVEVEAALAATAEKLFVLEKQQAVHMLLMFVTPNVLLRSGPDVFELLA